MRPRTVSGLPYNGGPITIGGAIDGSIWTCFGTPPSAAPICAIVIMMSGDAPLKMLIKPPPLRAAIVSLASTSVGVTYMKCRYCRLSAVGSQPASAAAWR